MDKPNIPRGLRNNNPLNIKRSSQVFQGESSYNTDPTFKRFSNPVMGYRAAFCIIRTYVQLRSCRTFREVLFRWCPDEEVCVSYLDFVCKRVGVAPEHLVSLFDREEMVSLVSAMSQFENGVPASLADVRQAYSLAFGL